MLLNRCMLSNISPSFNGRGFPAVEPGLSGLMVGAKIIQVRKMGEDKDRDEDISDIFRDLGKDFSRLLDEFAEQGEEGFSAFSNIDNLEDMPEFDGFDVSDLEDLFRQMGPGSFGDFEADSPFESEEEENEETGGETLSPNVDIYDRDDSTEVFVELPGVEEEDIELDFQGEVLKLRAEAAPDVYETNVNLPEEDLELQQERFNNGILHLTFAEESG